MALGSDRARQIVQRLQHDVTSGRWPVNSKIPTEAELAAEFGVGRSTVREAVRSLAHLGLLEPAPGRGTFVRSLNPVHGVLSDFAGTHTWSDILGVRRALEIAAADAAARNPDSAALLAIHAAHAADLAGEGEAKRGESPGQFHSLLVSLAGNKLLADLYAGIGVSVREGLASGAIRTSGDVAERHAAHSAILAAVAAGNPHAAAVLAGSHADSDLEVVTT